MDVSEGYVVTYKILGIFRYFFIITPAVLTLATILSLIKFKKKKIKKMFNYRDTTNALITLFTLLILSIPALIILLYRTSIFLIEKGKNVSYSLVTDVIIPIFQLKAPMLSAITGEIAGGAIFILPIIILAVMGILIKRKDTASKTMIIMAALNLLLFLVCYKLYSIYYQLFEVRMLY